MCDLFGGGGGGGAQGQTNIYQTSSSLPGWVDTAAQANYDTAKTLGDRPYQQYPEARLAGFTPDQQAAFGATRAAQGAWEPAVNQAIQTATGATTATWPGADQQSYMNPFTQNVVDTSMAELNRQGSIQRSDIERAANMSNAYGGSRHGVVEGEQMRGQNDAASRMLANLYSSGYQNAQQQFNADRAAQLSGAQTLGGLAGQGQQYGLTDINALLGIGQQQQQLDQAGADVAYSDFQQQRNYPIEMLNLRMSALANSPYTTSTMQQVPVTTPQPNWASQLLGAGTALAGAGNMFGWWG